MSNYDNEGRIALFKTTDKKGNNQAPDFTGKITIEGTDYKLGLWSTTAKSGLKYLSGKVNTYEAPSKDDQGGNPHPQSLVPNDDIAF